MKAQKTHLPSQQELNRKWFVVDAEGQTLGRLASEVAVLLRGKHKVVYTPSMDTGDFVIVVNAEKIRVTGNKLEDKAYYRHSGVFGNLKTISLRHMIDKRPRRVVELAVKRMLPKTRLGRKIFSHLKVYEGTTHPHAAQKPEPYVLVRSRSMSSRNEAAASRRIEK